MASSIFGSAALTFKTVAVSGQSDIVADSSTDTLTVAAGSNITLTTNASTDTLTIAAASSSPTIGDTQVAYATAADTIGGSANLTFNSGSNILTFGGNAPSLKVGTTANGTAVIEGGALGVQVEVAAADGDATHPGGELTLSSGSVSGNNQDGGQVLLVAGSVTGDGNGGFVAIQSGNSTDGGNGGNSGNINIRVAGGNTADFHGGNVLITAGTGAFGGGYVQLNPGTALSGSNGTLRLYSADGNQGFEISNTAANLLGSITSLTLTDGSALRTDTTTAHTALFQAYDVDGTAYKTFATLTNGNTPDFTIGPPSGGTVTLQATTFKSSDGTSGATAGPFTTITSIRVKDGLVTTLTGA